MEGFSWATTPIAGERLKQSKGTRGCNSLTRLATHIGLWVEWAVIFGTKEESVTGKTKGSQTLWTDWSFCWQSHQVSHFGNRQKHESEYCLPKRKRKNKVRSCGRQNVCRPGLVILGSLSLSAAICFPSWKSLLSGHQIVCSPARVWGFLGCDTWTQEGVYPLETGGWESVNSNW